MSSDTIAAIATPPGKGGVGIIRISGPLALPLAQQLLGNEPKPRYAHYTRLQDTQGELIDTGLLLFFPQPASFTGEDVLELQLHGSPQVLAMVLRLLHARGCRAARPGEFSERAFLNGRIDLTQAEAIADLISAGSEAAARAATRSLQGVFSQRVQQLLQRVIEARVHVEAAIDFPEEEIDFLNDGQILRRLDAIAEQLAQLRDAASHGQRLSNGLQVSILGAPNAGKSSLLNRLSGADTAIVTAIPGTTRDLLREQVELDGLVLTLVDTAGLRDSTDPVELEGMRRARQSGTQADHLLLLIDDTASAASLAALADLPTTPPRTWVFNKIDLSARAAGAFRHHGDPAFAVSVTTGAGMPELISHLRQLAGAEALDGSFSARQRHVQALQHVDEHVQAARARLLVDKAGELVAEELHLAQDALASVTGQFGADDLLGEIFGSFCIGK